MFELGWWGRLPALGSHSSFCGKLIILSWGVLVLVDYSFDSIENSGYLANSISDIKSSEYIYRLSFENKNQLEEFKKKLDKDKNIQKINIVNS